MRFSTRGVGAGVFWVFVCCQVWAAESFIVKDIRIEGLRRISAGTVFNYLPVKVGDVFDDSRSADAVRALFKTGFFSDVQLERNDDVLVVKLSERQSIASVTITGNKDVKSETLLDALKQIGLAEGRVFDRSSLDRVEQELRRQYFSLGKYGVGVESKVTSLENNRVGIAIDIDEGKTAKIREINIVGNKAFPERQLLKQFKLTAPTLVSFFTKTDQYSKQKLSSDLEALRSFYLDRGYVNFNIDSTQVSITPDKKEIYITINATEGEPYTIGDVKLAGEFIVPQEQLLPLVTVHRGQVFSRREVTQAGTNIQDRLGDDGYAFANVNAVPEINKEAKTVAITYFVDPGKRTYVRRINFAGNTKTRDEVLRREMRQMEGAWVSTAKVKRSKTRLERLSYFEEVNVETPAVSGITDQVDVNFNVKERPSGNLLLGVGFSQTQGIIFNTSITQDNFLGSGKRVNFVFNNSDINRRYALGYTDPFFTVDGVSMGFNLSYQETNAGQANITRFNSQNAVAGVQFGIPISEVNFFNMGLSLERTKITNINSSLTSDEVRQFIAKNGDAYNNIRLDTSFTYDTRNKGVLPDRGALHRFGAEVALPGGTLQYYKIDYRTQWYYPLSERFTLMLKGQFGYGDGYLGTDQLPFFENFYLGGPRSIRGYQENTLGRRDSTGRPFGGNLRLVGNAEVILPIPFLEDLKSVRISAFADAGNVYDTQRDDIVLGEMRYSAGLAGMWVSPFGLLSVSVAQTFNEKTGDQTQPFQFTFGTSF